MSLQLEIEKQRGRIQCPQEAELLVLKGSSAQVSEEHGAPEFQHLPPRWLQLTHS